MNTSTWKRWSRVTVAGSGLTALTLGVLQAGCTGDKFASCKGSECTASSTGGSAGADGDGTTATGTSTGGAGGVVGSPTGSTAMGGSGGSGGASASGDSGGSGGSLGSGAASAGGSSSSGTDGGAAGESSTSEGEAGETGAGGTATTDSCEETCDGTCCDGECVDLESNMSHCGLCGLDCDLNQAEEACVAGSCVVTECWDGAVDCNGVASDGCERNEVGIPEVPELTRPMLGAFTGSLHARDKTGSLRPEFVWSEVEPVTCDVVSYQVQVDDTCDFSDFDGCDFPSPELDVAGVTTETFAPEADLPVEEAVAPLGRRYYWRVRACEAGVVCSEWSEVFYVDVGRVREDVTGDGYADVVGATEDRQLIIARGSADFYEEANFETISTTQTPLHPNAPQFSLLGDVNGDGFNDVGGPGIAISGSALAIYVWFGAEAFGTLPGVLVGSGVPQPGSPPGVWAAGDHDHDGFADLLLLRRSGSAPVNEWRVKFGGPTLADAPEDELLVRVVEAPPPDASEMVHAAASGDFNGDGYPDHVIDGYLFQEGVIFLLRETSELVSISLFPAGDVCKPTMATLDFNGDDIDDLAVLCRDTARLAVVMGRRDFASDTVKVWKKALATEYADLAAGDIDNSGFDDLIVSDGTTFLGSADPRTASVDFLSTAMTGEPIVLGDHDADGDLDVMRAHHWYRGAVTAETSGIELTTEDGEELTVIALAR